MIQIRFDGPPGPEAGRFVEVEDADGQSIRVGQWVQDGDYWLLRISRSEIPEGELCNLCGFQIGVNHESMCGRVTR